MKRFFSILALVIASCMSLHGQDNGIPYIIVEQKPTFNGGDADSFIKYVQQNIKYPENALENGVEGKVTVNFVVDANGKIRNAKVVNGVDDELNAEALRVVESAPAWTPAKQNGKNRAGP